MSHLEDHKENFLRNQLWQATIRASFGRAGIYINGNYDSKDFRKELFSFIDNLSHKYRNTLIDEDTHLNNIHGVQRFSAKLGNILDGSKLKFGICQKLLNLYLKYLWCAGLNKIPPHFPVDRVIQQMLKVKKIIPWTRMKTVEEYMQIISVGKRACSEGCSLAELELKLYNNR